MGEKPEGQRPTSGRRVTEPAAYLTIHKLCSGSAGRHVHAASGHAILSELHDREVTSSLWVPEMLSPTTSAARRSVASMTCAYVCRIRVGRECPSLPATVRTSTPPANITVAAKWRR